MPISQLALFCVYARHAGFVREVPKDSERDFSVFLNFGLKHTIFWEQLDVYFCFTIKQKKY